MRVTENLSAVAVETPLGWAGVALGGRAIRKSTLFHRTQAACTGELRAFGSEERDHPLAARVRELLLAYTAGHGDLGEFAVELPGATGLQRRTWLALRDIPKGETRSYGWLARYVGEGTGGSRAIGTMMGANPIPLWLPCHRVVAGDGSLHGFGGGLEMKRQLLELEGALPRRLLV